MTVRSLKLLSGPCLVTYMKSKCFSDYAHTTTVTCSTSMKYVYFSDSARIIDIMSKTLQRMQHLCMNLWRKIFRIHGMNRNKHPSTSLRMCSQQPLWTYEGTYVLDVDASDRAMGAVLQQEQEGMLRIIGYTSRIFNNSELKYCIMRKELAATIFG